QARPATMAADLLLWPRVAGRASEGLVGQGGKRRSRPAGLRPSRAGERAREPRRMGPRAREEGSLDLSNNSAPARPAPRAYLATPLVDDPGSLVGELPALLAAADIAAVLVRLKETDQRTMISRVKALAPIVQNAGAALLLDGHVELVARGGADGAHLTGIAALEDALPSLKPDRIAGIGGPPPPRHSMSAGAEGAGHRLFGGPRGSGPRPAAPRRPPRA